MDIYIYNLVFIAILAALLDLIKNNVKHINIKKVFVTIICFQLIIIQGLRATSVGTDVDGYVNLLNIMKSSSFSSVFDQRMEFGFVTLVKIISLLQFNTQTYLFILSACIILPLGYTIYKYSDRPFISFYVYITLGFYSASFCTIRQHIAYGTIFLAIGSIKQRKLWKFILIVLFASTIHSSALIFLPSYFLARMKLNKFTVILSAGVIGTVFVFRFMIAEYFINNFYTYYEIVVSSSGTWMIIGVVLLVIGLLTYKKVTFGNDNHIYYNFIITALTIMLLSSVTSNAMRVADFYYIFMILYVPALFKWIPDKRLYLLALYLLLVCLAIIYLILLSRPSGYGIVPYKFFWQ